jgi:peptide/nickel transport system permease protein
MTKYVLSRLGEALISVLGLLALVFFAARLTGDPAAMMLPIGATPAQIEEFRQAAGLDRPLPVQFVTFLAGAVRGDLGTSLQFQRPALAVVLERWPATLELTAAALFLGTILGALTGMMAALKRGTVLEFFSMSLALLGQATPVFWLGIILIMVFSVELRWLPAGGREGLANLVLPAVTLAMFSSASVARLLRSSMVEVLKEDYIRTARAKGLVKRVIYLRHAARNALIPVVTILGILAGELLGGAVVTETIFSWPGVGRLILFAIETKDFPVVQAGVVVISSIFILVNLLVDLSYGILDPRIRLVR